MTTQPIIQLHEINKIFRLGFFRRRVHAVNRLSLTVHSGEIFGFLGPNGAGKTTTIKMMMGLIFPTSGRAELFGLNARDIQAKARLGFLPEHPYFYEYLTGFEFLDFYGRLFDIPRSKRIVRVERLLEQVGLSHAQRIPLRKYSKGMIQRVGIAQALINDPDLVVLDEPMSGLDPIGRKDVRDIIFRLKENGKTVFFSSHILQDVEMICDRVAIVTRGRLRNVGPLDELLQQLTNHEVEITLASPSNELVGKLQPLVSKTIQSGETTLFVVAKDNVDKTVAAVVQLQGQIESIIPHKGTLEDLFVQQVFQDEVESTIRVDSHEPNQATTPSQTPAANDEAASREEHDEKKET